MSLIYTEGYLESKEVDATQCHLGTNIKNILIVPPKDNHNDITVTIYERNPYDAIYTIHLLQEPLFLNVQLQKNINYWYQASQAVQVYYEKEGEINV